MHVECLQYMFHSQSSFLVEQVTVLGGLLCWVVDAYVNVYIQMCQLEQADEVSTQYVVVSNL